VHVSLRRAGGYSALAVPALMWTEFFGNALSRRGYDLLTRPFSDLATRGTPNATGFDLGFFLVPGVLTVFVGAVLWLTSDRGRAWRAGSAMIVVAGVFLFATGIFRQDPASVMAGIMHGTMAQICFAIASAAPLVLFVGSTRHTHLGAPRRLWLLVGLATLAIEGFGVLIRPLVHLPDGFFQRPFTLVLTVWFIGTGVWLLRMARKEGLPAPA
jgi:hypothetical membrane protein